MNKTEFIAKVAAKAGVEKKAAAALVDAALEVATDAMKEHEPISIVGFGTLSIAHREERTGKNPKTGETLKIPARSGKQQIISLILLTGRFSCRSFFCIFPGS